MENAAILVRGAREHNLRNVDLDLPRNRLIVFTGVSGSGKSSLAFDTLYAEGQRRYVESLSPYARQFLGQMRKPDVDLLAGLAPSISIQQKTAGKNPRSTVGTVTEIHDYFRVLFARVGTGHCPECGDAIAAQSRDQILDAVLATPAGTKFLVMAPVVRGQKGEYKDLFQDMIRRGFLRARVDGALVRLADDLKLDRKIKHHIEIVVDRLQIPSDAGKRASFRPRLADAVEQALTLGEGNLIVSVETEAPEESEKPTHVDRIYSAHYACAKCGTSYEPPSPQLFSFNSPHGMCAECDGLGSRYAFDPELLVAEPTKSLWEGAIPLVGAVKAMGKWRKHIYQGVADTLGIDLKTPWERLSPEHQHLLLSGSGKTHITYEWKQHKGGVWKHGGTWEGIVPQLLTSFKKTAAGPWRMAMENCMRVVRCPGCDGQRLNRQARAVRVAGKTLVELLAMPIGDLVAWLDPARGPLEKALTPTQKIIASEVLKEIRCRSGFLLNVGLEYLALDRSAPTLSGGEAQRIRLAGQIGSGLVGVLYILDEPSIGLHPRDNERLLRSLERLRDMGNTVLVVEHDEETMRAADYLVDFGPGPGVRGGEVVAAGSYADVVKAPRSLTGNYLSGKESIAVPKKRRSRTARQLVVKGAKHNNLKNLDVEIPLGLFVCVTGVSGSGKSTLVNDVLKAGLLYERGEKEAAADDEDDDRDERHESDVRKRYWALVGGDQIDKLIDIDQSPIGRTPRSNPATYVKAFDEVRSLYAEVAESKARGYKPGRFSFNKPGGRCEACEGNGSNRLEMDFLADVWVSCPICEGRRFNRETLQIRFKDKNIHDVLEMDVQEAVEHFANQPKLHTMLRTLHDVGLDYVKLGQPSPTLSGGEAQRIKLAKELTRPSTGKTLYILDEPTTGLHFHDVKKLLEVLHGFVEAGNTVVVIEHNLDVLKTADWLIDLGPDGGAGGGQIVCAGTPESVAACKESHTGQALAPALSGKGPAARKRKAAAASVAEIREIRIEGAGQHNLKNVDVSLPRDRMTVCCGPSGSGKSSLAMDTLFAEGQRRYVESLSAYARQFLGQMAKPKVEHVSGLSPAIAIEQQTTSKSPRSTVGTVTEIYDYLRILYARLGVPHCPACDVPIGTQTADEIVERILSLPEGTRLYLLAPIERKGQEKYETIFHEIRQSGFQRVRIDGKSHAIDEAPTIDHRRKHAVEVVVDRIVVRRNQRSRLADSVETALERGSGTMRVAHVDDAKPEPAWKTERFSQHFACDQCGKSYEPLNPHHYSFNSPLGWCPSCEGLGVQKGANPAIFVRDPRLSLRRGALAAWPEMATFPEFASMAAALAAHVGFSLDEPYASLDAKAVRAIHHGTGDVWLEPGDGLPAFQYKGILPALSEATRVSHVYRRRLDHLVGDVPCATCRGSRLRDDAAACRFQGLRIGELCEKPLHETLALFENLDLPADQRQIAGEVLREVGNRVRFLVEVGLDYVTLARGTPTLSGGESQRIRLASQIGSGLTGVLYVLDEPTIGLHPRDNRRLVAALARLRDLGNTLVLVEHDREVIASADHLLDFGPGAGVRGGQITASGTPKKVSASKASLTGQYLSGKKAIPIPATRRPPGEKRLVVVGARQNNLKNVDVAFPLGLFVVVAGVSGSGKSSLVHEILNPALARKLHRASLAVGAHETIQGVEHLDKAIDVDQAPLGNTPSSNPATYTGVFDLIRDLFAQLPDSRARGYQPKRFSFNKPGGRCETCEGNGQKKIEMHFLPDVWVECDVCQGSRYDVETLTVKYKGKSIADVLRMSVAEALELFGNVPKIRRVLQTLADVGLDYLALGQSAPTLSGGEAQRVKLAAELARPSTGRTIYLLDEPTTGLHFDDVRKLLDVLQRLVDLGNTVIVVEHNLDVIKSADWVIELGPEAGAEGGRVVAEGPPETVARADVATAPFLRDALAASPRVERVKFDPLAADAEKEGDVPLEEVGKDAAMPWEVDGRRWHTEERRSHHGKPCRWEGNILTWVEQRIREAGAFPETNWRHRTTVEIAAPVKSQGWFFHAHTGMEWLVRLVFRVGKNTFKQETLDEALAIPTLDETKDVEVYGSDSRVRVANRKGPWQEVWMLVHRLEEIDTPAFRAFLAKAAQSFHANLGRMATSPEDLMPWKVAGEKWHLGEKGFPPGRKLQWDRPLLPRLLDLVRAIEPKIEVAWDNRIGIGLRVPEIARAWGSWKTKASEALECRFLGKKGQFNLGHFEAIGVDPTIERNKDGDLLVLRFLHENHLHATRLKTLLAEHLAGFRAAFAKE